MKKDVKSRKTSSKSKVETRCEIDFVWGNYDCKTLGMVFPTPKYIVLSMGTELYERQDPDIVMEATYRYTNNWDGYKKHLEERAHKNQ